MAGSGPFSQLRAVCRKSGLSRHAQKGNSLFPIYFLEFRFPGKTMTSLPVSQKPHNPLRPSRNPPSPEVSSPSRAPLTQPPKAQEAQALFARARLCLPYNEGRKETLRPK
jgi:hypothetical protein